MKVILKRNYFASNGQRFRKSVNKWDVREISDELCFDANGKRLLPKDAEIVSGEPKAPVDLPAVTLRDHDADRAAAEAAGKAAEKAEEEDAAADFKRKLALEQAAESAAPVTRGKFKRK